MVGRPREFEVDDALDAAMRAFWSKGYEATSLTDLMSATGLHKGSLYQTFGDKHSLFIQALKRYLDAMRVRKNDLLSTAPTPLDGMRNVMHSMIDIADDDSACPMGCMAINSLVELAPHDDVVKEIISDHGARMRASFEETIGNAQLAGQINKDRPAELIASMLMTFMAGIASTLRGNLCKADAHKLLDAQIEALS
jgi:TetR/AcrR family transcriptional repressor of nem operon